jgi:mycothiol system anti-sigma-R factor
MVCDDVKRIVYFYLDGQLSERRATDFQSHVHACRGCDDRLLIQKRLRNFILRHLTPVVAPDRLRDRLHADVEQLVRDARP